MSCSAPWGGPYDTLEEVIGIRQLSLLPAGIRRQLPAGRSAARRQHLTTTAIRAAIDEKTKLVTIQRSKGYATRPSFSVEQIGRADRLLQELSSPTSSAWWITATASWSGATGAHAMWGPIWWSAASLRIPAAVWLPPAAMSAARQDRASTAAPSGSVHRVSARRSAPIWVCSPVFLSGTVSGSHSGGLRCCKGCDLYSRDAMKRLGFRVIPGSREVRRDIIQAVDAGQPGGHAVPSARASRPPHRWTAMSTPEPWAMPGYDQRRHHGRRSLRAGQPPSSSPPTAPSVPPYAVYFQGGLTWYHAKLGILMSLQKLHDAGLLPNL